MSKNKPRHNYNKPQNKLGGICPYYEDINGLKSCENSFIADVSICKGNPHNCIKIKYHKLACRSDRQKLENSK